MRSTQAKKLSRKREPMTVPTYLTQPKNRRWPINEIALTSRLVAASLAALLVSCAPSREKEFDKYEAAELLTKAELVEELIERASVNHSSNLSLDSQLGQVASPALSNSSTGLGAAGDQRKLSKFLGTHQDFTTLFESAHQGDASASWRVSNFFASEDSSKNLVLSYMYLKLAVIQGAKIPEIDLKNLKSQMSSLEIGLADEGLSFCKIQNGIVEVNAMQRMLSECPLRESRAWAIDAKPRDLPTVPK